MLEILFVFASFRGKERCDAAFLESNMLPGITVYKGWLPW